MGLVSVPILASGSDINAASHRAFLLGLDQLLDLRYGGHSWRAYTTTPDLQMGDAFLFGIAANLRWTGPPYDPALETPPDPDAGAVIAQDQTTRVLWLTGYDGNTTLVRRHVTYTGEEWWIGTVRPDRFENLRFADILVEAYETDPGGLNTFTWLERWDRYGIIRIHNGNRSVLHVAFENPDHGDDFDLPPYGVATMRRDGPIGKFARESKYLPLTAPGDPAKWESQHEEISIVGDDNYGAQYAAAMGPIVNLVTDIGSWCRLEREPDSDSTAREQASFTGAAPLDSDYLWDWLLHAGNLLSVVTDLRDSSSSITELRWRGIRNLPDTTWDGHIEVEVQDSSLSFRSQAVPPAGALDAEWVHDLIPLTSNLTLGQIFELPHIGVRDIGPSYQLWAHVMAPVPPASIGVVPTRLFSPDPRLEAPNVYELSWIIPAGGNPWFTRTLDSVFPVPAVHPALVVLESKLTKSSQAIGRHHTFRIDPAELPSPLLLPDFASFIDPDLIVRGASHIAINAGRRRFLARQPRKYMAAGMVSGATITWEQHPEDLFPRGTLDGLGGALGWAAQPVLKSKVMVEASDLWIAQNTVLGRRVYRTADVLHVVGQNILTPGWWAENRTRIIAGSLTAAEVALTWRVPRLIEQWNDFANAVNRVYAVDRANATQLFRDTMPAIFDPPFRDLAPPPVIGRHPPSAFAFPADYLAGSDRDVFDPTGQTPVEVWAGTWGIPIQSTLPDIDALTSVLSRRWRLQRNDLLQPCGYEIEELATPAWHYEWHLEMFGDAGPWDLYHWVKRSDAAPIFTPLGIALPPGIAGEPFTPTYIPDPSYSLVSGTFSTGATSTVARDNADNFTRVYAGSGGSWIRKAPPSFRLISANGLSRKRMETVNFDPGTPGSETWVIVEIDEPGERLHANEFSPFVAIAQSDNVLTSDPSWITSYPVYPSLRALHLPAGGRLIATPEPVYARTWDPVPAYPEDPTVAWTCGHASPPQNKIVIIDVLPGEVVTAATISTAAEFEWAAWHVAILNP